MNKSARKYIWEALNSPLVVVSIALTIWPLVTVAMFSFTAPKIKQGFEEITSEITSSFMQIGQESEKKALEKLNTLKLLEVINVKTVPSSWPTKEKVIGTIVNNSDKTLKSIKVNASFYDVQGNLIDVENEWLHSLGFILPKQSVDFSLKREIGVYKKPEDEEILASRKSASVKINVSDFDIVKTENTTTLEKK